MAIWRPSLDTSIRRVMPEHLLPLRWLEALNQSLLMLIAVWPSGHDMHDYARRLAARLHGCMDAKSQHSPVARRTKMGCQLTRFTTQPAYRYL